MIAFKAILEKFGKQGEKTGWTYIFIPFDLAEKLNPKARKSFRVKGKIDTQPISGISLLPMGEGNFILSLNASLRKKIGKSTGHSVQVQLEVDKKPFQLSKDLLACLLDEPTAQKQFKSLPSSHQKYYSNWVENAKTPETKTKRIAHLIYSFQNGLSFREMLQTYSKLGKK